ncbi:MAG: hypothetical protein F4110_01035 [Acidimicrobiaceae bacterium]|nr:hypothetical protein [Acidimicrobiaceae bacterium]MYE96608.1 hypothetical protein [Acidimicrobiaceae bacterium]MYI52572.1 hypothetical protein [Acidimicrobiaceae bacterium]
MTGRLAPVSRQQLIRRLRRLGWSGPVQGSRHAHMVKDEHQLTIPNPHLGDIGADLLVRLLRASAD